MYFHKNIRLSPLNYVGSQSYFVTFCCFNRRPIFSDASLCTWLLETLRAESAARSFAIHAYCVMPDHLHFLAEGLTPASDLANLAKTLKLKTSRAYQKNTPQPLWQKKYFDHILRPHEQVERVAWYIWMNPIRKGLSQNVGEYLFAGSFTHLVSQMKSPSTLWTPPWKTRAPASEGGRYNPQNPHDATPRNSSTME